VIVAIVLAFAVGLGVGLVIGRRRVPTDRPAVEVVGLRSRRATLSDEAFVPSDDILERLRLAAEGKLDPAEVGGAEPPSPSPSPASRPRGDVEPPLPRPELTEAERRVLERLRNQRPDPDTP
jgi:hypothetical protein